MDLNRQRSDLYENCIFEESIYAKDTELSFFQAIHQEADVVVENIDAIRAMAGTEKDAAKSVAATNAALKFIPIQNYH